MEIGAAEYREAALLNLQATLAAHTAGCYIASHYLSGLSVECTLRAYRWRIDSDWDGRHSLAKLLEESGYGKTLSKNSESAFSNAFVEISRRWRNEHRFASAGKLTAFLYEIGATLNVRGDKLKENSRVMTEAANYIVGLGEGTWDRR